MHKIRNEKASAIFQENSTRQINKTKYIIGNLSLLFQMKQKKFLCAISSKQLEADLRWSAGSVTRVLSILLTTSATVQCGKDKF